MSSAIDLLSCVMNVKLMLFFIRAMHAGKQAMNDGTTPPCIPARGGYVMKETELKDGSFL